MKGRPFANSVLFLHITRVLGIVCLLAVAALMLLPFPVARAATITVNGTADDLIPGDGTCTLREAISNANSDSDTTDGDCPAGNGADTIVIPAGAFFIGLVGIDEDGNASGDLDIYDDLTISGAGPHSTTINGNTLDRVFDIGPESPGITVEIDDVTITNGQRFGGGIRVNTGATLVLSKSIVSNNLGGDVGGGGIYNAGTLTIQDSVISGNEARRHGAGIHNLGALSIANTTISGNVTEDRGSGGGIYQSAGTLMLDNVTITDNSALNLEGFPDAGFGGGIRQVGGTISFKNTIVAGNTANDEGPDCSGTLNSQDYNLVEDTSGCTIAGVTTHNITGQDPLLDALGDNGGETLTHALQPGSPAIDAGSCVDISGGTVGVDQRGIIRPQSTTCDIGAYEFCLLCLFKNVDVVNPIPGQSVIFTLGVLNRSGSDATNALVSDTLPSGLTFAGPVVLEGTTGTVAQDEDDLPALASGLTIGAGERITVTFPATVNLYQAGGTALINTAAITSTEVITPQIGLVGMTVLNVAPVAEDDIDSTDEDVTLEIGVLDNDDDLNGDSLSVSAVGMPAYGDVTTNGVTVTYTPTNRLASYNVVFTYTISDAVLTDTATVMIAVTADNDAPAAMDDSDSTTEETAVIVDVLENDRDPDASATLFVSAVGTPEFGGATTNGVTVTYTPTNQMANYSSVFTYTVSDGSLTDTATVTITVSADNDAPIAFNDAVSTPEDTPLAIAVLDNDIDPEGLSLTVVAVTTPASGETYIDDNTVTYTPTLNFTGTDVFTYTISDIGGLTDTATVSVAVAVANDPPNAMDDAANTDEDVSVAIDVLDNDSDPDEDILFVDAVGLAAHGNVAISGTLLIYVPTLNFYGTDTFTYTVSDGDLSDTAAVAVTVNPINDAPTISDVPDQGAKAGIPKTVAFTIDDVDTDLGSLTLQGSSSNTALVPVSGITFGGSGTSRTVTLTSTAGLTGTATITLTVDDGSLAASVSFVLTVSSHSVYLPFVVK
jgi:uncharacterized repeat protein (TIGR01451 family)/CSLREA domain-containing protein